MLAIAGLVSLLVAVWLWRLEAQELSIAWGLYGVLALIRAGLTIFGGV
jgi:hypothetical protein